MCLLIPDSVQKCAIILALLAQVCIFALPGCFPDLKGSVHNCRESCLWNPSCCWMQNRTSKNLSSDPNTLSCQINPNCARMSESRLSTRRKCPTSWPTMGVKSSLATSRNSLSIKYAQYMYCTGNFECMIFSGCKFDLLKLVVLKLHAIACIGSAGWNCWETGLLWRLLKMPPWWHGDFLGKHSVSPG